MPRHPLVVGFPLAIEIPIQWGEMDAQNHLNNTVYFRYAETARIEYFRALGFLPSGPQGIAPILHSVSCRFRVPLTYPDRVLVGTRVTAVETDRMTTEFRIVSTTRNAVAAEGQGIIVSYDYEKGTKAPIPDDIRRRIEAFEGRG